MSNDGAARLGLVAAALVAALLFAPRVLDVGPGPELSIPGSSLARSLAPTGDRAVLDVGGRKPAPIKSWLFQRPATERAWAAALLAAIVLVGFTGSQRGAQVPPRRLTALLRRASRRRAPPAAVVP